MSSIFQDWDQELFLWLNNLGTSTFDSFWVFSTQITSWIALFIYFIVILFYYYKGYRGLIMFIGVLSSLFIALTLSNYTKIYFERLRPNNVDALVPFMRILQEPTSYSFFSGHAASSFVIVTFLVLAIRKYNTWVYLAYIWPVVFAYSRIYVGVHYPSDIIVGAVVGVFIAILGFKISDRILRKV